MKSEIVFMRIRKWGILFFCLCILLSFFWLKKRGVLTALRKSTDHFIQHAEHSHVFYEPGAEEMAARLALFYDQCIQRVELIHGLSFRQPFNVYMCASQKSLNEFIAMPANAPVRGTVVFGKIFIAPSSFNWHGEDVSEGALIHEMSHLHVRQYCGFFRTRIDIPSWFHEGLADLACQCAGESINERELLQAFTTGRYFQPVLKGGLFKTENPFDYGISYPMFHAQTGRFVNFLYGLDKNALTLCVIDMLDGGNMEKVFEKHYSKSISSLFDEFKSQLLHKRNTDNVNESKSITNRRAL